jgi:hypothetical protein
MNALDTAIASVGGSRLTLGGLLQRLHAQGRLGPLVREALVRQYILDRTREASLSVTTEELQQAANAYRRGAGLHTAADTHAWLAGRGLSADDFEADLEEGLLAAKLKEHQTAAGVDECFSAHRAEFELLQCAQLLAERDELARELASQVRDEGRSLEDVAREHGLPVTRGRLLRKDLAGPLAEALASAAPGELVGPVATPAGFALVVLEKRHEPVLDPATRRRLRDELFEGWLADRMKEATFDPGLPGTPACTRSS